MSEKSPKRPRAIAVVIGLGVPVGCAVLRMVTIYASGVGFQASARGLAEVAGLISFLVFLSALARLIAHLAKEKWWSDSLDVGGKAGAVGTAAATVGLVLTELGIPLWQFVWPTLGPGVHIIGG